MPVTPAMRTERFVPRAIGADDELRDRLLAELRSRSGLQYVVAGRQGPDDLSPRIVVSVWASPAGVDAARLATDRPEAAGEAVLEREDVEDLTVRVSEQPDRAGAARASDGQPGSARILRVFRGLVRTAELDADVRDVETGTLADIAAGTGPLALFLAVPDASADRFATVSVWAGWSEIEAATGGNPRNPVATRQPERLVAAEVAHYEVLTTLRMPVEEVVGEGVELAIALAREPALSRAPSVKVFEPSLIVRQSTAPPRVTAV